MNEIIQTIAILCQISGPDSSYQQLKCQEFYVDCLENFSQHTCISRRYKIEKESRAIEKANKK